MVYSNGLKEFYGIIANLWRLKMGQRRDRLDKRMANQTATRRVNSVIKQKERARREEDIITILGNGELPYTPGIMSWLSVKLDKKSSRITSDDVKALLA